MWRSRMRWVGRTTTSTRFAFPVARPERGLFRVPKDLSRGKDGILLRLTRY